MALVQAVQGILGLSGAAPAPSEWRLGGSWDGARGGGVVRGPGQCHVFEGPDSAKPDQLHWYMDPSSSGSPAL